MGFGTKTDLATGRKLDLDKSYRLLIKPTVQEMGLECVRADEIPRSGTIDVVMYQELLTADIVIADLSTANPNALYELGIRHALRPWTTIVISENKLPYPFDLNHILITGYTHLGDAIDFEEVLRFRKVLGEMLTAVLEKRQTDSPVYTFLHELTPPALASQAARAINEAAQAVQEAGRLVAADMRAAAQQSDDQAPQTLALLIEQGEQAIQKSRFAEAKALFAEALTLCDTDSPGGLSADFDVTHGDSYLIQRLTLATYKAKQPDEISALNEALQILNARLNLAETNDPETVGLAGAIEKRLFDAGQGAEHLRAAIRYYARGYYLRDDRYNGINLAYLLNLRVNTELDPLPQDQIADLVWANRIRLHVLTLCEQELETIQQRETRAVQQDALHQSQRERDKEQKFWSLATKAEAYFGLGEFDLYQQTLAAVEESQGHDWMMETFKEQIGRLRALLEKHGHLLNPPWPVQQSRMVG
jgi:hypothetical protein